ncbi:MAG: hypothetical protein HQK83_01810 [Fibrobacteria bacterium]|nr:hypothetical protein [Fibrobacteria bacterium]
MYLVKKIHTKRNFWLIVVFCILAMLAIGDRPVYAQADTTLYLHGQLVPNPQYPKWLVRWDSVSHNHEPVMIVGPGDPESFLFLDKREEMIDRIAEYGGDCLYIMADATGDTKGAEAYVNGDARQGYEPETLDDWERVLSKADSNNIVIVFFFYDDDINPFGTSYTVSEDEERNIKQLVQRFDHLKNLVWVQGEEATEKKNHLRGKDWADKVRQYDRHDHIIGMHAFSMMDGSQFREAVKYFGAADASNVEQLTAKCSTADEDAYHNCIVNMFEQFRPDMHVNISENTRSGRDDEWRTLMWSGTMGGAAIHMQLRTDILNAKDQELIDYRNMKNFFEATDFTLTVPKDEVISGDTKYALAGGDSVFIGWSKTASSAMGFSGMKTGVYSLKWYDVVTGEMSYEDSVEVTSAETTFPLPDGLSGEVALYARLGVFADTAEVVGVSQIGINKHVQSNGYQKAVFMNGATIDVKDQNIMLYDIEGKAVPASVVHNGKLNGVYFIKQNK